ncbi:lipid A export permease/ATP-binding protein MsbA [uncultured Aquimonas sp.]|uniref:lipid A export permease/ATP-binding protein MsbA n=1 Tax=uncultured Aquimonas sp. TaxID=385483 RepID=UPI00086F4D68|nr:lipid A export permease/ATP-binding protein MsbA [uncultured Aquimonas sp.]ODU43753.1 MAG: lipid A export permease/ATP-binding protein MsbA [Xanthomonadaceae bacterium SCN 69-123]
MKPASVDAGARASPSASYRRLLGYARAYWGFAAVAVLGMAFDAAASGGFAYLIKPMLDDLFVARDADVIRWLPLALVGIFVLRGIGTYATDYSMARVGRGVVRDLRIAVFAHYQQLPASWFDREPSGQIIARVIYSAEQVAQAAADAVKVIVLDCLLVIAMVSVMLWHSVSLTLYLFIMAPLAGVVWQFVGKRFRRINRQIQGAVGEVTGMVEEAVDGHREVRIYGGQAHEARRFGEVVERNFRLNLKVAATSALSTSTIQLIAASVLAAIIWRATRPDLLDAMSPGTFMSLITAMLVMLPSLKRLTTVQAMLGRGIVAAQDLFAVLDTPAEADRGSRALDKAQGDIEFAGVSLNYADASALALDRVSLRCAPGTVTALVGRSGSGKSSLVSLLPRFYEPSAGAVRLDGHALAEYRLADLRAQIALVSQRVVLFAGSIADNIAFGALRRCSRDEIEAAAEAANAMEFIRLLPQGLDSPVGEGGALLSGGQRQRIAIARALLKNAPILILDEATSALDSESERLIQDALARLMRDRTTLVIAHRLSTIEHADQIVVLDAGRVVETGSHAELLARGGMYASLHRLQFSEAMGGGSEHPSVDDSGTDATR